MGADVLHLSFYLTTCTTASYYAHTKGGDILVRRNLTMTPRHSEKLEEEARKQQVSMSEVLRKALDMYFGRKEKQA